MRLLGDIHVIPRAARLHRVRLTNGLAEGKRICTNAATVTGMVKWANLRTEQIGTLRPALFAKEQGKHSGLYARLTATSA